MSFETEIATACANVGLADPLIVAALVQVESGGNPFAWNPEPHYRYFWNVRKHQPFRPITPAERAAEFPPADFPTLAADPDQEWWGQQASWGLMQVMGAVAREQGFGRPYLTELCDPVVNLGIGCQHLSRLVQWASGSIEPALAAYNGGKLGNVKAPYRNQAYVDKVLAARAVMT